MSIPEEHEIYKLTDFIIDEINQEEYLFYDSDADLDDIFNHKKPFATIEIPPFCKQRQAKLGIFLKEFSTLLNEMLVIYDKEKVARLFKEAMTAIFPEDLPDYELGFYEWNGGVYCTIQYTAEGHKKVYGRERYCPYAETLAKFEVPAKRVKFQKTDEIWEKWHTEHREKIRRIEEKARRRHQQWEQEHPDEPYPSPLRDYVNGSDVKKEEKLSDE